jgi:hypothetical protein
MPLENHVLSTENYHMTASVATLLQRLEDGLAVVNDATAGLASDQLAQRPTGEEWSIGEVLVHLADSEIIGAERFRRIIADDDAQIGWYDEARWAERLRYRDQDPWAALALFRTMRAANLTLLRLMPPEVWARSGVHSKYGPQTLADMVTTYIEHAEDHAAQIVAIRRRP